MPATELQHIGHGLFIVSDTDKSSARFAFVHRSSDPTASSMSFSQSWRDDDSAGTHCFLDRLPTDTGAFAQRVRKDYPPGKGGARRLLWFHQPADPNAGLDADFQVDAKGATRTTASFRFGNASVLFPKKARVDAADDRFRFTGPLVLYPDELDPPVSDEDASQLIRQLDMVVSADRQATVAFDVDLNLLGLAALDIGLRYFWKDADEGDALRSLRFPLFDPGEDGVLPVEGHLDPYDVGVGGRSHYRLRGGGDAQAGPLPSHLRTASGARVDIIPVQDGDHDSLRPARLVFAPNPALQPKVGGQHLGLTPDGDFEISLPDGDQEEVADARLLTGLAGAEYVTFRPRRQGSRGDLLSFFAGRPALARVGGPLSDELTTSWVGLRPHPEAGAAATPNRYFAQPDDAPLFTASPGASPIDGAFLSHFEFPAAVLPQPSPDRSFPMVPHAGVNGQASARQLGRRVESSVISPARKRKISEAGQPARSLAGGDEPRVDSTTPQGLVAGVQGSHWTDLLLAFGDDVLLGVENVSDAFQNALQSNKLFLVVSKEGALGAFSKGISIGGWPFQIDLGASVAGGGESEVGNVLIFKFFDESIEDLVRDLGVWSDADGFNSEPTRLQSWLLDYFADARKRAAKDPDDPEHHLYSPFVEKVLDDPDWNGIIALDVKIPLDSLPEETQGLMGGIDTSRFKAHHLGIELSQVSADATGIDKSSLFALIDYRADPASLASRSDPSSAYDFKVKTLQVLFANSEIEDFRCRILLTLNELFDEKASLEGDGAEGTAAGQPNTIELDGSYERHKTGGADAQGQPEYEIAYVFTYEGKKVFRLDSPIIKSVEIDKVRFTTLASDSEKGDGGRSIASEFSFWGSMVFGEVGDLDFFSFDDLGFAELKLGMTFDIVDGQAGQPSFYFDPGNISFDVSFSKTRQESLLGNFPLRLNGFTYASKGFSVEKRGYISVPDLIPGVGAGTDTPHFGLSFTLDLGSMGALTSVVKGFAIEVLAAWAPESAGGGVDFGVKLPQSGGGKKEIGIQGVLTLKVDDFGLRKIPEDATSPPYVYAFFLKKSVLTVLSTRLPPGDGEFDTLLFVPRTGKGSVDVSSLGWFVAYSDPGKAEDDSEDSPFFLKYLCLGQHVKIPDADAASLRTVEQALDTLDQKILPNAQGVKQIEQLKQVYDPDGGWLIGIDVTLYKAVRLGIVFAEPKLYGLLVGLYEPEALRNFQFQVLYRKVSDDIGVYQIVVQLPDAIRQLEFGAVSVTMPVIGVDIYTNGDFRLDFGFPQGRDFSSSLAVQAFPFVGFGGFYFARLSGATSTHLPELDPDKGRFEPVLELGFGLSLGVGKTIEKGIMRAGLTVTFEGILEGTAAYFVSESKALPAAANGGALTSVASALDRPPDFYLVRGRFALVGTLYGTVDFGIVKATLSVTIWAGVSITFEAYEELLLEIEAGVTVRLTVVVGGIKVFGHKIEIKVSFSFETTIRYQWVLVDDREPPYAEALRRPRAPRRSLAGVRASEPIAWMAKSVFPERKPLTLYLAPHLTSAAEPQAGTDRRAQLVATLAIECAPSGEEPDDPTAFDLLVGGLLAWAIDLHTDSKKEVDAATLADLSRRLALPVTLARTAESPLVYFGRGDHEAGPLQEFLAQNYEVTVAGLPDADAGVGKRDQASGAPTLHATVFPVIPDLILDSTGSADPVRFWEYGGLFDDEYQDSLAAYLAQLTANLEPARANGAHRPASASAGASIATLIFEDYFALLIKSAAEHAERHLEEGSSDPVAVDALVEGMRRAGTFTRIAGMAARFLQHGLRLPPEFPVRATLPAYRMDGQQIPIALPDSEDWSAWLSLRDGVSWIELRRADPPVVTIAAGDEQARQRIRDLDTATVSTAGFTVEPLPTLLRTVASYSFENHMEWAQQDAGDTWSIWPFPASLRRELQVETTGNGLALTLHRGRAGDRPRRQADPDPELPHSWALFLDFTLRRIPQEAGFLSHTYQVGGTNEASRDRLDRLLDRVASGDPPGIESCRLLFPRNDGAGLVSPAADPGDILLLKTNLSTESAPPEVRTAGRGTGPSAEISSASLKDAASFLRLLWEVSIVNAPGYYLFYRDSDGQGLPAEAFDEGTGLAHVSLVVMLSSQSCDAAAPTPLGSSDAAVDAERVAPFSNALVVMRNVAESKLRAGPNADPDAVLYARAPEVPAWRPAFEPGCVGFRLTRPNPNKSLSSPLAGAKGEAGKGLTRSQVMSELRSEGIDYGAPEFAARLADAGDVQAQVENLFNLITYWVPRGDEFVESPRGLPVGPIEPATGDDGSVDGDRWTYEHVVPVYRFAKDVKRGDELAEPVERPPRRDMRHYRPVGRVAPIAFQLLDIFGNEIATETMPSLQAPVRYFDPIIPIDRWPSLTLDWHSKPEKGKFSTLVVELSFDLPGYLEPDASGDAGEKRRRRIETDLERYDQIAEQLWAPGVSLGVRTSLAPGHDLENPGRLIELRQFVNKIRRALARLPSRTSGDGSHDPISESLSFSVDDDQRAAQDHNIFEVGLDLELRRQEELLDEQAARVYPEARAARTRVPPRTSQQKSDGKMAFDDFAAAFEGTFPELRLAVGWGRAGPRSVFAVRIDQAGAQGIRYKIDPEGKGACFFVPAPLSNALISRGVLSFGDADAPARISGVDLDVWAREFLQALDRFLAADRAVPARQNAPEAYERIVRAKRDLADAISLGVTHVLEPGPSGDDASARVDEARRVFRQRLLVELSSAYEVDTVVQYVAAVENSQPEPTPANLYGKVVGGDGSADHVELSSAKLALPDGGSLLTFLFSTHTPSDQSHVSLDLRYQVTHVEHDISQRAGPTDRYRSSAWLSFIRPFDPIDLGKADIPVALREYPRPPSLLRQSARAAGDADCPAPATDERNPLQKAKLWHYGFTYQQRSVAQDTMFSNVKFNVPDEVVKSRPGADREPDLVDWLARFRRRYPELEPKLPSKDAVGSLAELVEGVAGVWAGWIRDRRAPDRPRLLTSASLEEFEYQHRIEEASQSGSQGRTEVEVVIGVEPGTPPVFPYLAVDVDGDRQCLAPEQRDSERAVYRFRRKSAPGELRQRTLIFDHLDVLETENAWGGVGLARNLVLLPGDPAPSINPEFVYQTPLVRFGNKKTPLLNVDEAIDLGGVVEPPPDDDLSRYLSSFFSRLFGGSDGPGPDADGHKVRRVQLTCRYGYDLQGHDGPATGPDDSERTLVYIPVLHQPPFGFDLARDSAHAGGDSFSQRLARSLEAWMERVGPSRAGGFFLFDLGVFAVLSDAQLPILRLRKVWLGLDRVALSPESVGSARTGTE